MVKAVLDFNLKEIKKMKKATILLLLIFFTACAARQTPLPEPKSSGARLFADKCGVCHSIPHPKRHTITQWERMIDVMDKEMRHRGMASLAKDEKSAILGYLKRNSR